MNGNTGGTRADDRIAEVGTVPLRVCKYQPNESKYLTDCRQCMRNAGGHDIVAGETPFYEGSPDRYRTTRYHKEEQLDGVPLRADIECDWPYALRRCNGSA